MLVAGLGQISRDDSVIRLWGLSSPLSLSPPPFVLWQRSMVLAGGNREERGLFGYNEPKGTSPPLHWCHCVWCCSNVCLVKEWGDSSQWSRTSLTHHNSYCFCCSVWQSMVRSPPAPVCSHTKSGGWSTVYESFPPLPRWKLCETKWSFFINPLLWNLITESSNRSLTLKGNEC